MASSQVAVVITCYELGRTVPEAIDSILAQTAAAQEIVLVDDGSRDPLTRHVLAQLENGEPRVRLIRAEHGGVANARNLGVAETQAPLVVLLDGDDAFEPTYLEQAARQLTERDDISFVCCALQAFGGAAYRWKPPPYTVAEALGRGACGHISTVFRRSVWDEVGGFDPTLPAYEDVDFWLRAIGLGHRGLVLDEALVRYRVRPGSRYHDTVVRGGYLRAKEMLLSKHIDVVADRGEDIFVTLLDFQRELTGHAHALEEEAELLEESLAEAAAEIEIVTEGMAARGIPVFDWGELGALLERTSEAEGDTSNEHLDNAGVDSTLAPVERQLMAVARAELVPEPLPRRTLRIGPSNDWPSDGASYDVILVEGALERTLDPGAALACCQSALRPGGQLFVAACTAAVGDARQRGFTEASIQGLLCDLFPPGDVRVASYGNLQTSLEMFAPTGRTLEPSVLLASDPAHATVVAGSARRTGPERRRASIRRRGGATEVVHRRPLPPSRGAILAYHRIADLQPDEHQLCTPPGLFAAQMELIAQRYRPLSLRDLVTRAQVGDLPARAVAITFDDGYADNLEIAAPILAELDVPATFFVNGTLSAEPHEAWWDTLERILLGGEARPDRLRLALGEVELDLPVATRQESRDALLAVHGHFLVAGPEQIERIVSNLVTWSGLELPVRDSHRLMTLDELGELGRDPRHRIGAHARHHLLLTMHDPEVQAAELAAGKTELEQSLGVTVNELAYPYGAADLVTAGIAEQVGFTVACTTEPGSVTAHSDPLRLPRLEMHGEDLELFRHRLEQTLAAPV